MNSLNMKMADYSENRAAARLEPPKLTHGGVGFSGIAATVCASVMSKDQSQTVTSICVKQPQISQPIGMVLPKTSVHYKSQSYNFIPFCMFVCETEL